MMKKISACLFVLFLINGCSVFDNEQSGDAVEAIIKDEQLIIRNNQAIDVYYFAVDKASLPYIFWAPIVSDENKIQSDALTAISLSEIFSNNERGTIVVFYWDEEVSEIFNIEIEE
jgi:PBP1b-binding outer membrane lipoprotein LpoB